MSYWYSERTGVKSYVAGVEYSGVLAEALDPKNKSAENSRLSTTASQDDYFKKMRLIKEAIAQLQSTGSVDPKIAKEVDVEALKESLKDTGENSSAVGMLGQGGESEVAREQNVLNAKAQSEALANIAELTMEAQKAQSAQSSEPNPFGDAMLNAEDFMEKEERKKSILQGVENQSLEERMGKKLSFYEKPMVTMPQTPPENVAQEIKDAYNPLEIPSEEIAEDSDLLARVGKSVETSAITEAESSTENTDFVEFTDEVSNKKVRIPLSQENAQRLKDHFGSLENASDYVKGFYYDAAYTIGYLQSDSNGDGKISLEEGVNLKGLLDLKNGGNLSVAESFQSDLQSQMKLLETIGFTDNIADFINHSLSQDLNFDSALSLNEMMESDDEAVFLKISNKQEVELFVVQRFSFNATQDAIDDALLNLGTQNESSVQTLEKEDLKDIIDQNYLNSLTEHKREEILKSDKIIKNMLESAESV